MAEKTKFFYEQISEKTLFACVMLSLPPFLFQRSILFTAAEAILFAILNFLKTGKIKVLPSLMIIAGIIFFSLLSPSGKILFRAGTFPVTLDSLLTGLRKGLTLTGMVFISKFSLSRDPLLPGKTGSFISSMFYYFDRITDLKIKIDPKKAIESIDMALMEAYKPEEELGIQKKKSDIRTTKKGKLFLAAMISLCWGLFILDRLYTI